MVLFFSSCGACAPQLQDDETSLHSQEAALPIIDVDSHPPLQEHPDTGPVDISVDSTTAPSSQTGQNDVQPLVLEQATLKESSASNLVEAKLGSPASSTSGGSPCSPRRKWHTVRRWMTRFMALLQFCGHACVVFFHLRHRLSLSLKRL